MPPSLACTQMMSGPWMDMFTCDCLSPASVSTYVDVGENYNVKCANWQYVHSDGVFYHRALVDFMLNKNPAERPTIKEVSEIEFC